MSVGRVKWFNSGKGYGFIETVECSQDVFVHFSEIEMDGYKTLKENMTVHFLLQQGDKGPCAKQVNRADPILAPESDNMSHLWQSKPAAVNVQRG